MTDKKRMGRDPLAKREGMDGLISSTISNEPITPMTSNTYNTSNTQKKPGVKGAHGDKLPRINMSFSQDNYDYLRAIAGASGVSVTSYVNDLIEADRAKNLDRYNRLRELMGE